MGAAEPQPQGQTVGIGFNEFETSTPISDMSTRDTSSLPIIEVHARPRTVEDHVGLDLGEAGLVV